MMTKYLITIVETLTYNLEVEGNTLAQAEENAFSHEAFVNNYHDDNDAVITSIALAEEVDKREHEIIVDDDVELAHKVIRRDDGTVVAAFMELGQAIDFLLMIEGG